MPYFFNDTNLIRDCSYSRRKWYSRPDPWEDSDKDSANCPEPAHKGSERAVRAVRAERSEEPVQSDSACKGCSHKDSKAQADLPERYSVHSNYSDKHSVHRDSADTYSGYIRPADKDSADIRAVLRPEASVLQRDTSYD